MIVTMSRVTVLGPRRLQADVADTVQGLGSLHIDHIRPSDVSIAPRALSDHDQAGREAIDAVRTRAEAILALLPAIEIPPVATEPYAGQSPDALDRRSFLR